MAEDVARSRPRERSGKDRDVRTSRSEHDLQSHGAPSMRFDCRQDFTVSTPFSHEAQTRSAGASLSQHFMHSHAPSVNRDARIWLAFAPAIPQSAQSPRVAASCEGICRTRQ